MRLSTHKHERSINLNRGPGFEVRRASGYYSLRIGPVWYLHTFA